MFRKTKTQVHQLDERRIDGAYAGWLTSLITNDTNAHYYPFSVSQMSVDVPHKVHPSLVLADTRLRAFFTKACEAASGELNGRARSNGRRQLVGQSVGCVYLPARTGRYLPDTTPLTLDDTDATHIHGWVRVPVCDTNCTMLRFHERGRLLDALKVPSSLAVFAGRVCDLFSTDNIWFKHEFKDKDRRKDGVLIHEVAQNFGSLNYLLRQWKTETRRWDALTFVPPYLFPRLTAVSLEVDDDE